MSSRPLAVVLFLILATVTAMLALAELPVLARSWSVFLLVALPALTVWQANVLREFDELPRVSIYSSSILTLFVFAAVSAVIARVNDFSAHELGLRTVALVPAVSWTVGVTLAAIAFVFVCHALGVRETPTTLQLRPRTRRERVWFAGLSFAAGTFEEFVYRGFLLAALLVSTGSTALSVLLAAAAFGMVHGYQAAPGAARAAALGVILTAPLLATGSLLPSVLAHTAIDLLLGLVLADRFLT